MKCIATRTGYDGQVVRSPDDVDPYTGGPAVFDMPDDTVIEKDGWLVQCDEDGNPPAPKSKAKAQKAKADKLSPDTLAGAAASGVFSKDEGAIA